MIKMISGVYGMPIVHPDGRTTVKAVGPEYGPFTLAPEKEKRLVDRKVAVYVDFVDALPEDVTEDVHEDVNEPIGFDETPPDTEELPELPEGVTAIPEYGMENTKKELLAIAEMCGLDLDSRMTKPEIIAAIDAHIDANMVDGEDEEIDEDGEAAPTFDASEAVL